MLITYYAATAAAPRKPFSIGQKGEEVELKKSIFLANK